MSNEFVIDMEGDINLYVLWIFPTEHKWKDDRDIAITCNRINNKFIDTILKHKKELGIELSNQDVKSIIANYGIFELNSHMDFGLIEKFTTNCWI